MDNDESRFKMLWIISKNKDVLESNGLKKSSVPIYTSNEKAQDEYIWIENGSVDAFGKQSNLVHKASSKKVDWVATLRNFLEMVKSKGLELVMVGSTDAEKSVNAYDPVDDDDLEARRGTR
ncbi:unnamed protein product [Phytophthora lilii]|uniref:Unnamed protein product n=1 Tax=Phytophthora lilii TaxID=2077276 RepID=A0A9W6UFN7_9STRA|nr:unnamed protein product [Phytophthora lilii]